jgi:hypothetical protein
MKLFSINASHSTRPALTFDIKAATEDEALDIASERFLKAVGFDCSELIINNVEEAR